MREGFTLVEVLVVTLIIGILAAFAVPQYRKSVETGKANDAVAMVNMIGTANRMYALDHGGNYASGILFDPGVRDCNSPSFSGCPVGGTNLTDPCNLVSCKYLAATDFEKLSYDYWAMDPTASSNCGATSGNFVACAANKAESSPFNEWVYSVNSAGVIGGAGTDVPSPIQ